MIKFGFSNFLTGCILILGCCAITSCSPAQQKPLNDEIGPKPYLQLSLKAQGLPDQFFGEGYDTKCSTHIIGYRFVVWLDAENVAVGFNTSPNCRQDKSKPVNGVLHIVVIDLQGNIKASHDVNYTADGYNEIVADGEASQGPDSTLLVRLQSVNLNESGSQESESAILLLDKHLNEVAKVNKFMEKMTLTQHALVFAQPTTFTVGMPTVNGPLAYSILSGTPLKEIWHKELHSIPGAMSTAFGEHSFAFTYCEQEVEEGKYKALNGTVDGAKRRCSLNVLEPDDSTWSKPFQDDESAELLGIFSDKDVIGLAHKMNHPGDKLVIWSKSAAPIELPWIPDQYHGDAVNFTKDLKRYSVYAMNDSNQCNALTRIFSGPCKDNGDQLWFVFDRAVKNQIVRRAIRMNSRAALSPDGSHYASFEDGQLKIYLLSY